MRKLVAGNWKMNGLRADLRAWASAMAAVPGADILVCAPHTLLAEFARLLTHTGIALGGQDCAAEAEGAHTGDISAAMLRDAGATSVILGHSERRTDHHETDALVRAKALAAFGAGLLPIVCVGESGLERDAGRAHDVVARQLAGSLPPGFGGVVAYEPIWAIGTGRVPSTDDVTAMHGFIRAQLGVAGTRILYGGSVKAENARAIMALPEVGGVLVGGASLDAASFQAISLQAIATAA